MKSNHLSLHLSISVEHSSFYMLSSQQSMTDPCQESSPVLGTLLELKETQKSVSTVEGHTRRQKSTKLYLEGPTEKSLLIHLSQQFTNFAALQNHLGKLFKIRCPNQTLKTNPTSWIGPSISIYKISPWTPKVQKCSQVLKPVPYYQSVIGHHQLRWASTTSILEMQNLPSGIYHGLHF